MVGLVLVSHSRQLAEATLGLVRAMSGADVPVAIAAGAGDDHKELGTDAVEISEAITSVFSDDGVVVLMDMGSAVLSAEMALDFLDDSIRGKVRLCPSSFVEGAVAAGVAAKIGGRINDVLREAATSLMQKTDHITSEDTAITAEKLIEGAKSARITIPIPNGLHARPVSKLIQEAAKYQSDIQLRNLTNGKGPVSIRSMTGVVALEALFGHEVELIASGIDADEALSDLRQVIQKGLGDSLDTVVSVSKVKAEQQTERVPNVTVKPAGVSSGVVIGTVYYPEIASAELPKEPVIDVSAELVKLRNALTKAEDILKRKQKEVVGKEGEIFAAQSIVLQDPALVDKAAGLITTEKKNAAFAWWLAINEAIESYQNLNNDNLRQRAADLRDVRQLVLEQLGATINDKLEIEKQGILVVKDLTPGQVTSLDKSKVMGVICLENGVTSHSSILLRSAEIPAIVQAGRFPSDLTALLPATTLAMDGSTGEIWINPSKEEVEMLEDRQAKWLQKLQEDKQNSLQPAITTDGHEIMVAANIGRLEDSESAARNGADGVGLLRTEFMFLDRDSAPTEEEQVAVLRSLLGPLKDKPVVIRTLDAGGDKNLPYLNMPKEDNPYLGVRAIRLCLRNRDLFQQQLRAILRIGLEFNVQVMFPMISGIEELREAKLELVKAHESLEKENVKHLWPIATGMMMEVPSAAILADEFAAEVDFMSIGTNDLTQYTMAMDRGNPELQNSLQEGLEPSVVTLIARIAKACKKYNILLAVCGEAAADSRIAAILMGLGVRELSMNGGSIPSMKQWIRNQSMAEMEKKAVF